jgi:predicted DNA-binding antitoxin AbrB/MazE fold protein
MRGTLHRFWMPFSLVDKESGKTYYLHAFKKQLKGGQEATIYYFADAPGAGVIDALPAGCEVSESYTGVVRKGVIALRQGVKLPDGTEVCIAPVKQTAPRLRGYKKGDPDFERAITAFAEAEASRHDPLEGEAIDLATDSAAREQFRKLLAGG